MSSYREFYGYYFGATDRVVRRGIADSCGLRRAPPFQIGFVVLEVAWTLTSVDALMRQREQE